MYPDRSSVDTPAGAWSRGVFSTVLGEAMDNNVRSIRRAEGDQPEWVGLLSEAYPQLWSRARTLVSGWGGWDLEPDDLVQETIIKLLGQEHMAPFRDLDHFLNLSYHIMRRILIDYVRAQKAAKRGGSIERLAFDEFKHVFFNSFEADLEKNETLLLLDESLNQLSKIDARAAEVIELRYFVGLTIREIAEVLGISKTSADRDLKKALARLRSMIRKAE